MSGSVTRAFLLTTIIFLDMLSATLPVAQLDRFMSRLVPPGLIGFENTAKSFFVTSHFLAHVLFAFLWGAISDRMGRRKPFIVVGLLGNGVTYLTLTLIQSLPLLYAVRFLDGAFSVMGFSLVMTCALDQSAPGKVGTTMGMVTLGMLLGNALGAPLGGVLGTASVLYPFYLGALLLFVAGGLTLLLPEVPIERRPDSVGTALAVLNEEKFLAIPYAYSLVERLTVGFFVGIFPLLMSSKFGSTPAQVGMYQGIFLLFFALLSPLGGLLSDRVGRVKPLLGAMACYGVVLWGLGLANQGMLFPLMALGGLLGAIFYPATIALVGDLAPVDKRGVAMGGFNVFGSLGFAAGPFLLGLVGDSINLSACSAVAGLFCLVLVLASFPFFRAYRRRARAGRGEGKAGVT